MHTTRNAAVGQDSGPHGRRENALVRALLRHYARNLRRSWRNTPRDAFFDATTQLEVLLAIPIAFPLLWIKLVLSRTIFPSLAHVGQSKIDSGSMLIVALGVVIIWVVDRKLKQYKFITGVEVAYDTARDRALIYLYYASGFATLGLGILATYYLSKFFPAP
jgi:hypothetical protein